MNWIRKHMTVAMALFLVAGWASGAETPEDKANKPAAKAETPEESGNGQRIGREANVNQKTVIGIGYGNGTMVDQDGRIRTKKGSFRLQVGDPPQAIEKLPLIPQTLVDGRTPAVVTCREVAGIRYEYTAFDAILPQVGCVLVLRLKAVNTMDKLESARWVIPTTTAEGSAIVGWCDSRHTPSNEPPWSLKSLGSSPVRNWTPAAPAGMRDARVGWNGVPISYDFRAQPGKGYSVAVGFCEGYWTNSGHRLMDVEIEGRAITQRVDVIAQGNTSSCVVVAADAPQAGKDGLLRVTVRPTDDSPDRNAAVSAVWIFENIPAEKIDCRALAAGQLPGKPVAAVACGNEPAEALAGSCYEHDWPLKPGEAREAQFFIPYAGVLAADAAHFAQAAQPARTLLEGTQKSWQDWWSQGATFRLPDREAEDLYYASLAYLFLMQLHVGDYFLPAPGPENYRAFWYRDGADITRAFDVSGHLREAEELLRVFWNRPLPAEINRLAAMADKVEQSAEGMWATPRDEYDSQGQAVWGLMSHYRLSGDRAWLEKVYPAILAGAKWTREARRTTKINDPTGAPVPYFGLFPKGFGEAITENHGGTFWGLTHVLYHNFWGVLGLRLSAEAAETLGRTNDAPWIRSEYEDFRQCVSNVCHRDFVRLAKGGYWKAAPDMDGGAGWWQSAALFPCEVISPHNPMLDGVYEQFRAIKKLGTWPGWPYVSTQWAQGHLLRMEPDEAEAIFWAYIRKATLHRTWCESLDPVSRIGSGDQPHGWAAANYVLLLRNMLLAERDGALWLCQAIPRDWLADGKAVEIEKAPTEFGNVGLRIRSRLASGRIEYTVHRTAPRGQCMARLWLRAPGNRVPKTVEVNGKRKTVTGAFMEFPLGTEPVSVVLHYDP